MPDRSSTTQNTSHRQNYLQEHKNDAHSLGRALNAIKNSTWKSKLKNFSTWLTFLVCFHFHVHASYKNRTATIHDMVGLSTVKSSSFRAELQHHSKTGAPGRPRATFKLCTTKQGVIIYYCSHTREPRRKGPPCLEEQEVLKYSSPSSVLLSQKLK